MHVCCGWRSEVTEYDHDSFFFPFALTVYRHAMDQTVKMSNTEKTESFNWNTNEKIWFATTYTCENSLMRAASQPWLHLKKNTYSKTSVDISPNLITHLNILCVYVCISATIYRSTHYERTSHFQNRRISSRKK